MKTLRLLLTCAFFIVVGSYHEAQAAEILPAFSEDVAVIIGNKTYLDKDIPEVTFAHQDARAMRHFAKDVLHIRDENIIFLEDASQAKMETAFGRKGNHRGKAFQYVKPDVSNLFVFYSGHGLPGKNDGKSYLLPVDADIETADINGYPTDVLYENLSQVEAKSVTIFLDACFTGNSHAGTLIKQASGAQILPAQTIMPKETNMTVVTAASKDQLASWDAESGHGLFTEYLLRALYGEADLNKDGEIRLSEVDNFLKQDMRYKARRTFNRDQMPSVSGDSERVITAAVDGNYPSRPELSMNNENTNITEIHTSLDPVDQAMFALKNANIRKEANVYSERIGFLSEGDNVHVMGKVKNEPWYAVEFADDKVGYVFESLLSTEKKQPIDVQNNDLEELQNRLARLEEQTKLGSNRILPDPPQDLQNSKILDVLEPVSRQEQGPKPNWTFDEDPYQDIERTLKEMAGILARQSFVKRSNTTGAVTRLNYNWIKIDADRCHISASLSLDHDERMGAYGPRKTLNIHDKKVESFFERPLKPKKRNLVTKKMDGTVIHRIPIYRLGAFNFINKKDRRLFKENAKLLRGLCPEPRFMEREYKETNRIARPRPKLPPKRRGPPPRMKRPPPPKR